MTLVERRKEEAGRHWAPYHPRKSNATAHAMPASTKAQQNRFFLFPQKGTWTQVAVMARCTTPSSWVVLSAGRQRVAAYWRREDFCSWELRLGEIPEELAL